MNNREPTTLITGLPRAGTTLLCALLNDVPDTVALVEPIRFDPDGDHPRALAKIDNFARETRLKLLTEAEASSLQMSGLIPDNLVLPPEKTSGLRPLVAERGIVEIHKPLSTDFHLFIKHHGEFTVLAEALAARYKLVSVVRHPLAALASWQTVDLPINRGHLRSAECFDSELSARLYAEPECLARQVMLMAFLFAHFADRAISLVVRYEDLIADPNDTLRQLVPQAPAALRRLRPVDPPSRYAGVDFASLAKKLVSITDVVLPFYPNFERDLWKCVNHGGFPVTIY
jgi:hypothetical protein